MGSVLSPFVLLACVLCAAVAVLALENGLGLQPPMGWNTWCTDGPCERDYCNETEIHSIADFMAASGMSKLGWQYVNLDDCWAGPRDASGNLTGDPSRFPSGMAALASYVHSKGLKLGLYTCAGNFTCVGGRPGSLDHYQQDAYTFANWGVDFVKMDWCNTDGLYPYVQYPQMTAALNSTGRQIFFNLCEWGVNRPWEWARPVGNAWRVYNDHHDIWNGSSGTHTIIDHMRGLARYAGPAGWNDPDFLMTDGGGQTPTEYFTEFSFWALWSAPLIVATDVRQLSPLKEQILFNTEVIAVNKDPLGRPGDYVYTDKASGGELWSRDMWDATKVVVCFNPHGTKNATFAVDFHAIGWRTNSTVAVRDLWAHKNLGNFVQTYTVSNLAPHAVSMLRLTNVLPPF